MTEPVHDTLARHALAPGGHAADSGYASAELLLAVRARGITLLAPLPPIAPHRPAPAGTPRTCSPSTGTASRSPAREARSEVGGPGPAAGDQLHPRPVRQGDLPALPGPGQSQIEFDTPSRPKPSPARTGAAATPSRRQPEPTDGLPSQIRDRDRVAENERRLSGPRSSPRRPARYRVAPPRARRLGPARRRSRPATPERCRHRRVSPPRGRTTTPPGPGR
jgi:hypothetical protein